MPLGVVANDLYQTCARSWQKQTAPDAAEVANVRSYPRVAAVASQLEANKKQDPTDSAFAALNRAKDSKFTQWQTVYAPRSQRMTMKRKADAQPIVIDFSTLDFAAGANPMAFDLAKAGGLQWTPCTPELNEKLVTTNYRGTPFLAHVPDEALRAIAHLPETFLAAH